MSERGREGQTESDGSVGRNRVRKRGEEDE